MVATMNSLSEAVKHGPIVLKTEGVGSFYLQLKNTFLDIDSEEEKETKRSSYARSLSVDSKMSKCGARDAPAPLLLLTPTTPSSPVCSSLSDCLTLNSQDCQPLSPGRSSSPDCRTLNSQDSQPLSPGCSSSPDCRTLNSQANGVRSNKKSEASQKTRLCRFFLMNKCHHGQSCKFAHGEEEKRAPHVSRPSHRQLRGQVHPGRVVKIQPAEFGRIGFIKTLDREHLVYVPTNILEPCESAEGLKEGDKVWFTCTVRDHLGRDQRRATGLTLDKGNGADADADDAPAGPEEKLKQLKEELEDGRIPNEIYEKKVLEILEKTYGIC